MGLEVGYVESLVVYRSCRIKLSLVMFSLVSSRNSTVELGGCMGLLFPLPRQQPLPRERVTNSESLGYCEVGKVVLVEFPYMAL